MLNFREKVNEIIQEKQECRNIFEMYMTSILNKALQYIREYASKNPLKTMEMLFVKNKNNRVYAKVYIGNQQDKTAKIFVDTRSNDEAFTVLLSLEHCFRDSGYQILSQSSIFEYQCFSVVITF